MKKIAFVLKGYPRLSETFIAQEIYLLEQRGFNIEIISLRQPREQIKQPINKLIRAHVIYVPEDEKTLLRHFASVAASNFVMNPLGLAQAAVLAVKHALTDLQWSPIKRYLQVHWLLNHYRLTKLTPPQHLHSHFLHTPTEFTHLWATAIARPFSISAHAKDIYTSRIGQLRRRINASTMLMTCTKYNFEFLRSISKIHRDKINLVYHGIDLDTFSAPIIRAKNNIPLFVTVGRLVEKKGYTYILQALHRLRQDGIQFYYKIFGAGEEQKKLTEIIRQLQLNDCVELCGAVTQDEIINTLSRADIYINGSIEAENGDRDGIPNTLAEAMALSVPVVATQVSGIPELIDDGQHGILVPQRDALALKTAIALLIHDTRLAHSLAQAGRQRVGAIFDSHVCIETCAQLLRQQIAADAESATQPVHRKLLESQV